MITMKYPCVQAFHGTLCTFLLTVLTNVTPGQACALSNEQNKEMKTTKKKKKNLDIFTEHSLHPTSFSLDNKIYQLHTNKFFWVSKLFFFFN